jgi:hypothetical protein
MPYCAAVMYRGHVQIISGNAAIQPLPYSHARANSQETETLQTPNTWHVWEKVQGVQLK